jgi:hypothetical protein
MMILGLHTSLFLLLALSVIPSSATLDFAPNWSRGTGMGPQATLLAHFHLRSIALQQTSSNVGVPNHWHIGKAGSLCIAPMGHW